MTYRWDFQAANQLSGWLSCGFTCTFMFASDEYADQKLDRCDLSATHEAWTTAGARNTVDGDRDRLAPADTLTHPFKSREARRCILWVIRYTSLDWL